MPDINSRMVKNVFCHVCGELENIYSTAIANGVATFEETSRVSLTAKSQIKYRVCARRELSHFAKFVGVAKLERMASFSLRNIRLYLA